MENLQNLKIQELDSQQLVNIGGGGFRDFFVEAAVTYIVTLNTFTAAVIAGFGDGANAVAEAHVNTHH
ncbi:Hypothetical protein I595_232 [Croceitalea dokdonensis DOKDO 023]|uniref:Class IIb bacteriocin, lactobin A/cerein 7B family n=1 Tax=Croceitalea dokdonensis DOKDO 023 TaxID=1300341 RepID=A0A0P7B3X7_9FLAO|nr:hypothetical protein [Croceitalea dokdonensis]KPM33329.1 Hypothetical protein I595_232 [Croceitalea dokdonensis DOKDO 023]